MPTFGVPLNPIPSVVRLAVPCLCTTGPNTRGAPLCKSGLDDGVHPNQFTHEGCHACPAAPHISPTASGLCGRVVKARGLHPWSPPYRQCTVCSGPEFVRCAQSILDNLLRVSVHIRTKYCDRDALPHTRHLYPHEPAHTKFKPTVLSTARLKQPTSTGIRTETLQRL